jgi:hypothetical protein
MRMFHDRTEAHHLVSLVWITKRASAADESSPDPQCSMEIVSVYR